MAEKNGEGGGEALRSTSPKLKQKKKKKKEVMKGEYQEGGR